MYYTIIYLLLSYPFFKNLKNKQLLIFLQVFPIFLSLAFQDAIGTDYYNYIRIFNGEHPFYYTDGALFKFIVELLKNIFNHERSMFVCIAGVQSLLYYKIILRMYNLEIVEDISLFIIVSILTVSLYANMFNILRNSVASLCFNLGVLFLLENKTFKYIELMIIGLGFHPSIILWNFIIILKSNLSKSYNYAVVGFYIILCFILNKIQVINRLALFIYNLDVNFKYKAYLVSKHMFPYVQSFGIGIILNLVCVIVSLIFYKDEKNKNKIFIFNLGYLGSVN